MVDYLVKIFLRLILLVIIIIPIYLFRVNNVEKVSVGELDLNFYSEEYSEKNVQWVLKADGKMGISLPIFQDGKMKVKVDGLYTEVDRNGKPKFNILGKKASSSYKNKTEETSCQNIKLQLNEEKNELVASTDKAIEWTFKSPNESVTGISWEISDYRCSSNKIFAFAQTSIYHPKRYGGSEILLSIYAIDPISGNVDWVYDGKRFEGIKQFIEYNDSLLINLKEKYISLDAHTGKVNWLKDLEISSMQLYDDVLYTTDSNGFLVAINSTNGNEQWRRKVLAYTPDSVPITIYKDNIYVSKGDGVSILNKMTGAEVWSIEVQGYGFDNSIKEPVLIKDETMYVQLDGFMMAGYLMAIKL